MLHSPYGQLFITNLPKPQATNKSIQVNFHVAQNVTDHYMNWWSYLMFGKMYLVSKEYTIIISNN